MQKAESEAVRELAETLRLEHHATLQRARAVAKSLQVEPPAEPTREAQALRDRLAQLSGSEFDAAFLSHMAQLHETEIASYARKASSDHDGVAAFVADALPKLKAHLAAVQALQQEAPPHRSR